MTSARRPFTESLLVRLMALGVTVAPVIAVDTTVVRALETSQLLLLEAIVRPEFVRNAYGATLEHHYLWHEFGDSALFLPRPVWSV